MPFPDRRTDSVDAGYAVATDHRIASAGELFSRPGWLHAGRLADEPERTVHG